MKVKLPFTVLKEMLLGVRRGMRGGVINDSTHAIFTVNLNLHFLKPRLINNFCLNIRHPIICFVFLSEGDKLLGIKLHDIIKHMLQEAKSNITSKMTCVMMGVYCRGTHPCFHLVKILEHGGQAEFSNLTT